MLLKTGGHVIAQSVDAESIPRVLLTEHVNIHIQRNSDCNQSTQSDGLHLQPLILV